MLLFLYKTVERLLELSCLEVFKLLAFLLEKVTNVNHVVTFVPITSDVYTIVLPHLKIERVF